MYKRMDTIIHVLVTESLHIIMVPFNSLASQPRAEVADQDVILEVRSVMV